MSYKFDVAFSFSSQQRPFADELNNLLTKQGLKVFYDGGQIDNLWGNDLYQYFSDVYQNQAKFCVLFLSKEYANSLWTRHELKVIQARAFKRSEEFILPIRFDSTEIPGLLPTIGYIDIKDYTINEISDVVFKKVKSIKLVELSESQLNDNLIEIALADAVLWAHEYLRPRQSINLSNSIASSIKKSLKEKNITPSISLIKQYLLNDNASFRIIGYFMYQIIPIYNHDVLLFFIICLNNEKLYAQSNKETRPLWQLIICIQLFLKKFNDNEALKSTLSEILIFLRNDKSIDLGGECKSRIQYLIQE